jgi:WD40 repeat protein
VNDSKLVAGYEDGSIAVWSLLDNQLDVIEKAHNDPITAIAMDEQRQMLITGSVDMSVRVWDLTNMKSPKAVFEGHKAHITCVALNKMAQCIASCDRSGSIRIWNLANPNGKPMILDSHKGHVSAVAFTNSGRELVSGGGTELYDDAQRDFMVRVWSVKDGRIIRTIKGNGSPVHSLAISKDDALVAFGDAKGIIVVCDLLPRGQ